VSRPETKQRIPHLILDTDFFDKPENVEAVDLFGDIAPAAILRVCLKLMNEESATMRKTQVLAMWRASGTDQKVWSEIIEYYLNCEWLIEEDQCIRSARIEKERTRVLQKRETLSANAKQKQSKSKANNKQKESKSSDTDTDLEDLYKDKDQPIQVHVGDFKLLRFDPISWEALQVQHQKAVLDRAIQLAESYIEKHKTKDPQRYRELKKEAESGKAYLNSWAISEAYKQLSSEKAAKNRLDRSKETYKKPDELPRPQPPPVKQLAAPPALTPEQIAHNKKLVEQLKNKTLGRMSA
jgi:hypothetical protein